jgi:hypothetical protein
VHSIKVGTRVKRPREQVYEFLDVMANHERFTDHMLTDWELSGPPRGVGSKARVRPASGPKDQIEIEVMEADRPWRTVEHGTGAKGKRLTTGTYTLTELADGGTEIAFELAWHKEPFLERLAWPAVKSVMTRDNRRAMERLHELLEDPSLELPGS